MIIDPDLDLLILHKRSFHILNKLVIKTTRVYTSLTSLRPQSSSIWLAQDCFEKVNDKVLLSLQIKETQLVYRNKKINNHTLQLPYIDSGQIKLQEMTAQRLVTLPKQAWM